MSLVDSKFICDLVNTPGWIEFIGDRNVNTIEDAEKYVLKILDNPASHYWITRLKDSLIPIGIVTFIKRDYLDFYDIGFAFLPEFTKNGYAYEASKAVLSEINSNTTHTVVLATTMAKNIKSIKLLEKLGLRFEKTITVEDGELLLYKIDLIGK